MSSAMLSLAILSGTLPRELGELSTLQSLYLGVNPLRGTIPLDLGYNFSRSDIGLSGNTLSGTLPASIWNICEKLVSLKIYESRVRKPVLNWARRYKIALGYARGLAYLHCLETPVTHGNVMSKNVLVDEFIVSKLTEFGLDKIMIPAVADDIISVVKAEGYKVPELQRMKKCNSRTDVYAFDILLLEILLGKKPGKNGRNGDNVDLPALVKVAVLEETTLEVFDMDLLKGIMNPMEEGLVQSLRLAMGCCAPFATVRRRWMK